MKILIFSGAGVSAESGLETFRGSTGLWMNYDTDKVCNIITWQKNYELVHEFYNLRRREIALAKPNAFHKFVAKLSGEHEVVNLTQNVDDLFEKAGCRDVVHLHGFIYDMTCVVCQHAFQVRTDWDASTPCPKCGNDKSIKPGVVFFNEHAPKYYDLFMHLSWVSDELGNNPPTGGIVVVAGTSEQVIQISQLVRENCYATWNVLVNERPRGFAAHHGIYDVAIQKTATQAVPELKKVIAERAMS